jgi:hypothetical protein
VAVRVVVDPHGARHPIADASSRVAYPVDVCDYRAIVEHGKVASADPTVRPEGSRCETREVRPKLVKQPQPPFALTMPLDQWREYVGVVAGCESSPGFETLHAVRTA